MPIPEQAGTLTVDVASDETMHVVAVAGELDLNTRDELAAVLDALPKPPNIVALDFSELRFVDSTGLKTLLSEHRRAREQGYEFVVAGSRPEIRDIFRVTAFDLTLPLADDIASVRGE
jgi:anti-sigma B factor antagonist